MWGEPARGGRVWQTALWLFSMDSLETAQGGVGRVPIPFGGGDTRQQQQQASKQALQRAVYRGWVFQYHWLARRISQLGFPPVPQGCVRSHANLSRVEDRSVPGRVDPLPEGRRKARRRGGDCARAERQACSPQLVHGAVRGSLGSCPEKKALQMDM